MSLGNPLRRVGRAAQRMDWRDIVADYFAQPLAFWTQDAPRHAEKLQHKQRALRAREGLSVGELTAAVLSLAAQRRAQRPPPVYVTGLGGSGSHWLSGMLHDLGDLAAAGEVYFPRALLEALGPVPLEQQACAIDAIHLLHGWPRRPQIASASVINCAAGVHKLPLYKGWDPGAVGIYLVRDPRDQVLSVTFRKTAFRRYEDPDASDEEYLVRMAGRNAASYAAYRRVADHVDLVCRYEDLCRDPRPALRAVLTLLGRPVDEDAIERSAVQHAAATIRAGQGTAVTNLDGGGQARPWYEVADPVQRQTLHTHLAEVIAGLGYPDGGEPTA